MENAPISKSYPYLQLAKQIGLDYGVVCTYADIRRGKKVSDARHEYAVCAVMDHFHWRSDALMTTEHLHFAQMVDDCNREFARIQKEGW